MAARRRQYQCGPATFTARERPGGGWWVHERWWAYTRNDDEEDFEEWHGPYTKAEAEARAAEWSER